MTAAGPIEIYQRAVRVNQGSGVLVTALSTDYSYVLTARHNLLKVLTDPASLMETKEIEVILRDGTVVDVLDQKVSSLHDIAVILVASQALAPTAISTSVEIEESMWLVGYPNVRRNLPEKIRLFPGKIESFEAMSIDISTNSYASVDEVRGVSGGGVYIKASKRWHLVAVECQMESQLQEGHNWLRCIGISAFNELIREHELPPILPPFLLSFTPVVEATFPLLGFECVATLKRLQSLLYHVIKTNIANKYPTPNEILESFGRKLLVQEDPECSLFDKKLWISWLEYLTLSVLLDKPNAIDAEYIKKLHSKRRFLYSGSDSEWTSFIDRIIQSDLSGLADDGLLLISNRIERPPAKTKSIRDLSGIVPDIALPLSEGVDIGIPRKSIGRVKIFHIDGLHTDCIVRQEECYDNKRQLDEHTVLHLLTETYREFIAR